MRAIRGFEHRQHSYESRTEDVLDGALSLTVRNLALQDAPAWRVDDASAVYGRNYLACVPPFPGCRALADRLRLSMSLINESIDATRPAA